MIKKVILLTLIFTIFVVGATTGMADEKILSGRDFVTLGELKIVKGVLETSEGEWFLQSDTILYEVHLGDHDYQEKINLDLQEGQHVTICGFVYEKDIAVVLLSDTESTFIFRDIDGIPSWSGQGENAGQNRIETEICDDEENQDSGETNDEESFKSESEF
ncbi:MAG: hypothetical protein K9K76_09385 [Halanaerobiales bacterium]|nr:hypothetical protein [Halanaerobiales bacterium]